jgi:exonuclease III
LFGYYGDCPTCIDETTDHTNMQWVAGWGFETGHIETIVERVNLAAPSKVVLMLPGMYTDRSINPAGLKAARSIFTRLTTRGGGTMFDALVEWLPSTNADIFCLQEITHTPGLTGWTRFDDGERSLPQRASLFNDLCDRLPHHTGVFVASDTGPVFDANGKAWRKSFGIATFIRDDVTVLEQDAMFVHGTFTDHTNWPIDGRPRKAQATRVLDSAPNRIITIVHLHGLRDPQGKGDTPTRHAQAAQLTTFVSKMSKPDDITIVCGDLNLLPTSETFATLGSIGLIDLVGTSNTRTSAYPKPNRHANYLLISAPSAVKQFDIAMTPEVSDHCPLILDI